jgi:hypothetical protein
MDCKHCGKERHWSLLSSGSCEVCADEDLRLFAMEEPDDS